MFSRLTRSAGADTEQPGAQMRYAADRGKGEPVPHNGYVKLDIRNQYIVYPMHCSRWQHLDFEPLARVRGAHVPDTGRGGHATGTEARIPGDGEFCAPVDEEFHAPERARFPGVSDPADGSVPSAASPALPLAMVPVPTAFQHPDLREAVGCWRLGQVHACSEQLASRLAAGPLPPGGRGLLGLCRGQEGDIAGALGDLVAALAEAPEDELLQAAALSARLRLGLPSSPTDTAVPGRAGGLSRPGARMSPAIPSTGEAPGLVRWANSSARRHGATDRTACVETCRGQPSGSFDWPPSSSGRPHRRPRTLTA